MLPASADADALTDAAVRIIGAMNRLPMRPRLVKAGVDVAAEAPEHRVRTILNTLIMHAQDPYRYRSLRTGPFRAFRTP